MAQYPYDDADQWIEWEAFGRQVELNMKEVMPRMFSPIELHLPVELWEGELINYVSRIILLLYSESREIAKKNWWAEKEEDGSSVIRYNGWTVKYGDWAIIGQESLSNEDALNRHKDIKFQIETLSYFLSENTWLHQNKSVAFPVRHIEVIETEVYLQPTREPSMSTIEIGDYIPEEREVSVAPATKPVVVRCPIGVTSRFLWTINGVGN